MTISIKDIKANVKAELKDIRDARKFAIKNGSIESVKDCENKAIEILKTAIEEIKSIDKKKQIKINYILDMCTLCADYIDVEKVFAIRDEAVRDFLAEFNIERRVEASDEVVNESDVNTDEVSEVSDEEASEPADVEESNDEVETFDVNTDETVNKSDETKKSNNEVFTEEDYTDEENRKREPWEDA